MPKFGKFLVSKHKNWLTNLAREASFRPKIGSASSIVVKKSVQQASKFGTNLFFKPPFGPLVLRAAHPYRKKVVYPLGKEHSLSHWTTLFEFHTHPVEDFKNIK